MNAESMLPRALTVALAVTLAAPLAAPANLNPAVALVLAGALGGTLCLAAAAWGRLTVRTSVAVSLALTALLASWLTVAAIKSAEPAVSLMGTLAQHTGATLWLVIVAWITAGALLAERKTLRELLAVVSVAGAAYSTLGVIEAATSGDRTWGSAAGPFENSSSLGAFLAVSLLACVAWWLSVRSPVARTVVAVCTALTLAGLAAAESRAGVAGVLAGLVIVAVLWLPPRMSTQRHVLSAAIPVTGIAAAGLLLASAAGALGDGPLRLVAALGTSRDAIWRSAAAQFAQAPWFGAGPEQFSAWVTWSFRDGLLRYSGTYDPHNALAGLALGGGVVALALWAVAAAATLWAQIGVLERTGRPRVLVPVVAVPAALLSAAMFAWLTPIATVAAAVLTGALFASDVRPARAGVPDPSFARAASVRAVALALGVLALLTGAIGVPMLSAEWRYARLPQPAPPAELASLYESWADPAYASLAVDSALASGEGPDVRASLAVPSASIRQHVDLALRDIFLAQDAMARGEDAWGAFAAAVDAGAHADPASALWFTVGAAQADATGRTKERDAYARKALELDPAPAERALLEGFLAGD